MPVYTLGTRVYNLPVSPLRRVPEPRSKQVISRMSVNLGLYGASHPAKKSCGARRQMVNASTWNGFVSLLQHFVGLFPVLVQPGLFSFYRLHRIRKRNIGCSLATKGRYCPVCEEGGRGVQTPEIGAGLISHLVQERTDNVTPQ